MTRKNLMKTLFLPTLAVSVIASGVLPVAAVAHQHRRVQTVTYEKTRVIKAVTIREHTVVRKTTARPSRPTRGYDRGWRPARYEAQPIYRPAPRPVYRRPVYRQPVYTQPVYTAPRREPDIGGGDLTALFTWLSQMW